MKKTLNILMICAIVTILFSCTEKEEFLDKKPLGDYSEDVVWSDPALVETFVNNMYLNAIGFPFSVIRLSDFSDESFVTQDWDITNFNKMLSTSDVLFGWSGVPWIGEINTLHFRWDPLYSNVRRTNIFFSKINGVKADESVIKGLKGQVYFLRAWTYFYLTALYGGVPIITKPYGLTDDFNVPRNSYEECINFIVGQLDSAAMNLPETYATDGHVNKGITLAFKSRVLLYAASDLHNPAKNGVVTSGFANPELLGYTGGDATARWTAAKNAAKAVIDLGKYSLYKATPAPGDSVAQNFIELFTSKGTSEDIFLQFFTPKSDGTWDGYNPGLYSGPNGYHNWGGNTPLGDLVDDYEMKDGSAFDWNIPAQKANPYINRDARFYATVLYEGVQWRKRPDDNLTMDPFSRIQVGHVYDMSGNMIVPGLDTRESPKDNWNGGRTGYYLRKYIDPVPDPQFVKQDIPFKHIRYGEMLLNYAEACIELGQDAEARTYINMIRTRAGQPNLPALTGDALRQAYRHERRIEFAYEDQRFWDVRRWLTGEAAYHTTHGVNVRYETSEVTTTYRRADGSTYGAPIFSKAENGAFDARVWNNKAYFFPIMRSEMSKNNQLIQNPGY
jgi:starch-binding outer membrane protein, SusD/RagB family